MPALPLSTVARTNTAVENRRTEPNKPERAEHKIPCKILEIMLSTQQKLLVPQTAEHPASPRPRMHSLAGSTPSAVQSDRTEPNKPERAEHTIPCKTLEIMPPTQQKLLAPQTAEHPASPRPRMHSLAGSTPSAVQSDRTEPNKPERAEHTIPCKTLEIMLSTQQKLLVPQTAEHPASPRPRMHSLAGSTPSAVQSDRTEPNKPERAEHTLPCKTLEIMLPTQQKLLVLQSAEHPPPPCSRVRPRAPQNRPTPNTAEHSRTELNILNARSPVEHSKSSRPRPRIVSSLKRAGPHVVLPAREWIVTPNDVNRP